jgi:hypothetical protein
MGVDPLAVEEDVPGLDLADGLEVRADRLPIERWIQVSVQMHC